MSYIGSSRCKVVRCRVVLGNSAGGEMSPDAPWVAREAWIARKEIAGLRICLPGCQRVGQRHNTAARCWP
jgi:Uma2 family endonuclease